MPAYGPLFRDLAAQHRAGIPWGQAVGAAAGSDASWAGVRRDLDRGRSVADAFRAVVDPLDAALLEAGERGGTLEQAMVEIADAHEEAEHARRERFTAQLYPLFVAHVAALLMPLPDLLQGRIGAALFWFALVLVPMYGFLYAQRRADRRRRPAPGTGAPPEPPPLVGPLRSRVEEADARALDALGRLYEAGVPLGDALDLAIAAGWGGRVAQDLARARQRLSRGEDLAGAWQRLPEDLARTLVVGEDAGSLGEALRRLAGELRFGVRMRRRRTGAVLPVVLLLVLGALVAWRLFAFYVDYYGNLPF